VDAGFDSIALADTSRVPTAAKIALAIATGTSVLSTKLISAA
jgi:hypothetical protein